MRISGLLRGVVEASLFCDVNAAYVGSWLPTFRDSLSVPISRVKQSKKNEDLGADTVPKRRKPTTNLRCVTTQKSEGLNQITRYVTIVGWGGMTRGVGEARL